jgi:hypothetical protein
MMKALIDIQLYKIELKMGFIDEYDKFVSHQNEMLSLYQDQMIVERMMLAKN